MASKSEIEQENEALKARLAALESSSPAPVKGMPLTIEKIREHQAAGHTIGNKLVDLSTGHSDESISKWEKWEVEYRMKNERNPVDGKEMGFPYEVYAIKQLSGNHSGSARTFQSINNKDHFSLVARPNHHVIYFPAGTMKAGQTYPCDYWVQTLGKGIHESKHVRVRFIGNELATGAPQK